MVNTTLPANIGSAARAMHTMGLSRLTVVNPKQPIDETSYSHAAGGTHILDNINITSSLKNALADSQLVMAASSRNRSIPRPVITPLQAAQITHQFLQSQLINNNVLPTYSQQDNLNAPTVSILFGREDRGLTNSELATAAYHIQIDANPDYPVLNIASAVQVIASFIYSYFTNLAHDNHDKSHEILHHIRQKWDTPAIKQKQQDDLNNHIIELMQQLELANKDDLGRLPQRISRLTTRIQLDEKEYQLFNAVVGKLKKLVK